MRAKWGKAVCAFAFDKLTAAFTLEGAFRDIIACAETGNVIQRISLTDILGFLANNDDQFRLVVEFCGIAGGDDDIIWPVQCGDRLAEYQGFFRHINGHLSGMIDIIETDCHDLLGACHGCSQSDVIIDHG